jgi:AI-2 transport protein TqsA
LKSTPLLNLTLALATVLMSGWLLYIGRSILLPIIIAVIVAYIVKSSSVFLRRLPVLKLLPALAIYFINFLIFALLLGGMMLVVATTVEQLYLVAPSYQANLEKLAAHIADIFQIDEIPNWTDVRAATLEHIKIETALVWFLSGLTNMGSTLFLVLIYAVFMVAERGALIEKATHAFADQDQGNRLVEIVAEINNRIGNYLTTKTLINVILGCLSYAIMWLMNVDFALFWAIVIGLTNYIPYVGSLVGVMLPVMLSLAQFASISTTLTLAIMLTAVQACVGNILEPRWIGRELNLSPLVVLIALSSWTAMWGVPGAILAIPMTSMMVIILGRFDQSRFIAVLLSERSANDQEENQR